MKANTYKYLFRVAPGKTPFSVGTASRTDDIGWKGRLTDTIYVAPCMYSWIRHWFNNEDDHLFAIKRPSNLNPLMMCCGINSHYHYCYVHHKELVPKFEKCVITHNYNDPDIQDLIKEHDKRSKERFGSDYRTRLKGYEYHATLHEWDQHHPSDGHPELILNPNLLRNCEWEELLYVKRDIFVGKESGLTFQIEHKLPKYGIKYKH